MGNVQACGVEVQLLDAGDRVLSRQRKKGSFERESLEIWGGWAKDARLMIDIGAYTGVYSILAKKCNPRLSVHAFEPNKRVYARLLENTLSNQVDVTCHDCALGDLHGARELFFSERVQLTSGSSLLPEDDREQRALVCVETLDRLFPDEYIDAIKIDVEGAEDLVLKGGQVMLARSRPRMIIEVLRPDGEEWLAHYLPQYAFFRVDRRNMICTPKSVAS